MLSKKNRISASQFFVEPGRSKRIILPFCKIDYFICQEENRFVFVVPKKLEKRAVFRNRTRRVLSEAIRMLLPEFKTNVCARIMSTRILRKEKTKDILPIIKTRLHENNIV